MNNEIKKSVIAKAVGAAAVFCAVVLLFSVFTDKIKSSSGNGEEYLQSSASEGERQNFLLLGTDRASGLTDVIMLVSVDTGERRVSVIQIPRDTYARFSDGSHRKLNSAVSALSADGLCRFLSESMCIGIEGYCSIDLDAFSEIVDAVGGVEIDLPFDMEYSDPAQNLSIMLKAGRQTLDGETAEQFVRYRSGYVRGDLGRMDAQKLFVSAFVKKVSEEMTPASMIKLVMAMLDDVNTNIGITKMTSLVSLFFEVGQEDITMLTLPGADIRSEASGAWYYVISESSSVEALREYAGADITAEDFDKNKVFLNSSDESFSEIYNSYIEFIPSKASDINEGGIEIRKR